jgi:hypothetical protein
VSLVLASRVRSHIEIGAWRLRTSNSFRHRESAYLSAKGYSLSQEVDTIYVNRPLLSD